MASDKILVDLRYFTTLKELSLEKTVFCQTFLTEIWLHEMPECYQYWKGRMLDAHFLLTKYPTGLVLVQLAHLDSQIYNLSLI